jgi:hypothetical protein
VCAVGRRLRISRIDRSAAELLNWRDFMLGCFVMSAHSIAKTHLAAVVADADAARIPIGDALHALLVTVVQEYKSARGVVDTRRALEFQMNNLADDIDYEFMRP